MYEFFGYKTVLRRGKILAFGAREKKINFNDNGLSRVNTKP